MHTNRRLFDLATRNSQKIAMNDFIRTLPENLSALFNPSQRVFHPELADLVTAVISKAVRFQDGVSPGESKVNVIKTASQERATTLLSSWIDHLPDGRYFMVVGGGNGVRFNDQALWISKLPGHYVSLPDQKAEIKALITSGTEECVLTRLDTTAAIVAETVGGYLPEEPSEQEIVFELCSWGLNG